MVRRPSRARSVSKFAMCLLWALATAQAAWAVANFTPQQRVGYTSGDQWEPAMAADSHGHIYILFPQYGAASDCAACTSPTMTLVVSNDNGSSWQAPHTLSASATGQFDAQIVVDPVDQETLYASWLQGNREVVVGRSQDFGRSWYFAVAEQSQEHVIIDKPILAVRGPNIYVSFNQDQTVWIAASHDYAQNFSSAAVNPNSPPGWSLAAGATVDPSGNVYFSWMAYARTNILTRPVDVFVGRSGDGGRTWTTTPLDVSGAAPDCAAQACGNGFLGAQIALASDASGTIYALWNSGAENGAPERIYFSSSTNGGASWSAKADVSSAGDAVEHCFPAITAGAGGDVRIAWMDTRNSSLWNVFYRSSSNGGATWSAETQLSGPARGYDYVRPEGFRFPFGNFFSIAIDNLGNTHAVWGEGRNYKSPGSIWYSHGR